MKQYQIKYESKSDFSRRLDEIRSVTDGLSFCRIVFYITWTESALVGLNTVTELVEKRFPEADYYGNEASGNIAMGEFTLGINVTCCVFEESDSNTELVWVEQGTQLSTLDDLWEYCRSKEGLRAVEMIPSMSYIEALKIDGNVPEISKDVLLFGGASVNYDNATYDADIIAKGHPRTQNGMAVMLYFGRSLVFSSYDILGWKGLGRLMEVTASTGKCIQKIDNSPAYSIYEKYLNLSVEDKDTLVFPLIAEEDGNEYIRTPQTIMPDKSMKMFANVPNGTKVRIAYGDKNTILDGIFEKAKEITAFNPEAIKAYSCAARRLFWGDAEVGKETMILEDIAPVCGFYTGGEILRFGRKLKVLNQTLAIVAMREKDGDIKSKRGIAKEKAPDKSLVSRLAYFTERVSEEQAKEQELMEKERLHNELLERMMGDDGVFLINCENDTRKTIKSRTEGKAYSDDDSYSANMRKYIDTHVAEPDREMMRECTSIAYIMARTKCDKEFTVTYRDTSSGFQHFYEMRFARYSDTEVLQSNKDNDRIIVESLIFNKLKDGYFALYGVDLETGLFQAMKNDYGFLIEMGSIAPYSPRIMDFASNFDGETRAFFEQISDIKYIKRRFAKENKATFTFKSYFEENKWVSVVELVLSRNADGTPSLFAIGFSYLDEDASEKAELQARLNENMQMIGGLASEYSTLYYVNIDEGSFKEYSLDGELNRDVRNLLSENGDPFQILRKYGQSDLIHPDDRELFAELSPRTIRERLAHSKKFSIRFRRIIEGEYRWSEIYVVKYEDVDERANVIAVGFANRDEEIRKEQEQQKQLQDALVAAEAASKSKTSFLFNMSHDIRTPMNAIMGFTNMAIKHIDDREKALDCLSKTQKSVNMLLSLINSVLEVSRIESGKATLEEQHGDVYYSFANIESTMHELAAAKDIKLTFEIDNIRDRYVYCDFNRCIRIFINVISNSIKYTPEGGFVKVRCEQVGSAKNGYGIYRYTFTDNGIGMSEDFQKHVFEHFSRENTATVSGIQGTGLGMAVCKSFVDLMGGTIECRSKQGEGTVFVILLPFKIQEGEKFTDPVTGDVVESSTVEEVKDIVSFAGRKVLLVEDNELNREIAVEILEEEGFVVEEAEDGSIAVDMLKNKGSDYFDCILMDIQMPVMNGYEATKVIRAMYPDANIPIIALSANAFAEDKEASIAAGMNDHVAKPINVKELVKALAKFL